MSAPEDQSDERIRWKPVLGLVAFAFVLFGAAAAGAIALQQHVMGGVHDDPTLARADIGAVQIGMVEPRLIELETRALERNAERKAQLEGYSWVDRNNGVIRIPIERGMELVVEGRR